MLARVSTSGVPVQQRTALLSDELARRLTSGCARALDGGVDPPGLDWLNVDLGGGLVLARGRVAGLDVERDARLVRDADDDCSLFVALTDGVRFEQNDRRTTLSRGDGLFVAHGRPVRSWWRDERFLLVRLPRNALGPATRIDQLGGVHLPADSEAMMLLRPYLATVFRRAIQGEAASLLARRQIGELVGGAIAGGYDRPRTSDRDTLADSRIRAMLAAIDENYTDPRLDMQRVAGAACLSRRAGYLLFAARGLDFTEAVRAVRLDRALERLSGSGQAGPRILDVALEVGFSDLSHFNRAFRTRFACTPTEARLMICNGAVRASRVPVAERA